MSWYLVVKEVVEILYMLSGVGLIIGLFFGFKQLKLMRDDYNTKNERASIEKSIEYLNLFATSLIPLTSKYSEDIEDSDVQIYKGPINPDFKFDKNCNPRSEYILKQIKASLSSGSINILNQFEFFSAAMMSGLADEELAFTPLAETFCESVEEMYVTLCHVRYNNPLGTFNNTIALYNVWKPRLEKYKLEKHRDNIDQRISKIEPKSIPSVWNAK